MKHLGDITKIHDAPFVDCITFGSPCFPAGTLVLTDKGYIEIENIKVGDRCLTHAGNWQTVTATGHKNAPTVKLKGTHYGIVSTYNHPFYSANQESKWNGNGYHRTLSCVGEWTPAAKMQGKRWAVPNTISGLEIPKIEKQNKKQNEPPEITPELMYVIGRWLADGWIRDGQRPNRPKGQVFGQIYICANFEKANKLEESVRSILKTGQKLRRIHERTVDKIRINNQAFCKWIKDNFGSKAHGKEIPAWAFCMPKEYKQSLVNGYFDGDGYAVKDGVWRSTTVSKKLAHGIRLLCETLGYSCSVCYYDVPSTTVIEGRTVSQKPQYQLRVSKIQRTNSIKQNGFNWYKCFSVKPHSKNQIVYNITVDNDHSYIVEGFVVHNCQDLSMAGKRAGLAGERSGLFTEAVRIIKEMRLNSNGMYPTFAVWENVPGAFSSNRGEDFRAVLEELAKIEETGVSIPRPANGKWAKAGYIAGNGWSIAWRTLDAQYWGVPQRRKRIALVVDFGGQRAGEILFERKGLSRHLEPSIPPWKGIARNPAQSTAGHDRVVEGERAYPDTARSLTARYDGSPCVDRGPNVLCIPVNTQIATRHISLGERTGMGWGQNGDPAYTLQAGHEHAVLCRAQANTNAETYENLSPTLTSCHDGPPIVFRKVTKPHSIDESPRYAKDNIASTLNTFDVGESRCNELVVFESHSQDARYTQQGNTTPACTAQWGTGGNNMPLVVEKSLTPWDEQARRVYSENGLFPALSAREKAGQNQQTVLTKAFFRWIVRRITPMECERLQGYPDGWTDIGEWTDSKGKRHKTADSPRYKALGNSIALPQWWWITCKMAAYLTEHATLGSLFDGIGGFPLVWETRHGKGTALWASEIEEFPIAVTKVRFREN